MVTDIPFVGRDSSFLLELFRGGVIACVIGDHCEAVLLQVFANCAPDSARSPGNDCYA